MRHPLTRFVLFLVGLVTGFAASADDSLLYGKSDPAGKRGGRLVIGSLVEPPALDPFHQAADARIQVSVLMYQGLMYEDPSGVPRPLLAQTWQMSSGGTVYRFVLRDNVKFHNGRTMGAEDVKYSYDHMRDPKNGSPGAGDLSTVSEIIVVDPRTVEFRLSKPNATLLMTLTNKYGAVVPKDYFAGTDARANMNKASVGTGPFRLKEFRPNNVLALERNRDYWLPGVPYLDEVQFVFVPNSASLLVALQQKRVDMALLNRPQDIDQARKVPGLTVTLSPSFNQKSLDLDLTYGPLADKRVRQAIALAIDKAEVMKASIGENGQVIGTMVGGMQERWGVPMKDLANQKIDLERAKKLLAEAGHAGGITLDLITIIGYDWMDPAAVTVASQLKRIGVNINIQKVDLGVWIKNFRARQMKFTFNDWATSPDPSLLYYRHFRAQPDGADFRNWNNAKASELLDRGQQALAEADRRKIYSDFQKHLAEEVPTIMMFSSKLATISNASVRNHQQHPTGWYFGIVKTWKGS